MAKTDVSQIIALKSRNYRQLLNNVSAAPVTCNIIVARKYNRKVENHSLPYFTYTCVLRGTGEVLLNRETYQLKPGVSFLRFPDEKFNIRRSKDYVEFSIALPPEFGTILNKYYTVTSTVIELELTEKLLAVFEYIFEFVRSNGSDKMADTALEMFKFISDTYCRREHEKHLPENIFIKRACDILRESQNSNCPGKETARQMGLGYESFRKQFRQLLNMSPKQYIMQLKFEKAAEMVLNGYSIKEITFELNYSEIPAFSRQFKKFHGISPAEYRKKAGLLYES